MDRNQKITEYLEAFCSRDGVAIYQDGVVWFDLKPVLDGFDFEKKASWQSVEILYGLLGYKLKIDVSRKYGIAIRDYSKGNFLLQFTPKEAADVIRKTFSRTPFRDGNSFDFYASSLAVFPDRELETEVRFSTLSGEDKNKIYDVLTTIYSEKLGSAVSLFLHNLESAVLSDAYFKWFKLFDTEQRVFGYRIRAAAAGYHKEVIMSHGFENNLQGHSRISIAGANGSGIIRGFSRVESQASVLSDKDRGMLESLKYSNPVNPDILIPSQFSDDFVGQYIELNANVICEPRDIRRYGCVFGGKIDNIGVFDFLSSAHDLRISKFEKSIVLTNRPVARYISPYLTWLVNNLPRPISEFVKSQIQYSQNISSNKLANSPAAELLSRSNQLIRSRVEAVLAKDAKLAVVDSDLLTQIAFFNRVLAMFCLEGGLLEFEAKGGIHERFDQLVFKSRLDENGKKMIDIGERDSSGKFKSYLLIGDRSQSRSGVW